MFQREAMNEGQSLLEPSKLQELLHSLVGLAAILSRLSEYAEGGLFDQNPIEAAQEPASENEAAVVTLGSLAALYACLCDPKGPDMSELLTWSGMIGAASEVLRAECFGFQDKVEALRADRLELLKRSEANLRGAEETNRRVAEKNKAVREEVLQRLPELLRAELPAGHTHWTFTLIAEELAGGWKAEGKRPSASKLRAHVKELHASAPEIFASVSHLIR